MEAKELRSDAEEFMSNLPWPGNVRQLENTCRWLTVMASGREIHISDLPPELLGNQGTAPAGTSWQEGLRIWAEQELKLGNRAFWIRCCPSSKE